MNNVTTRFLRLALLTAQTNARYVPGSILTPCQLCASRHPRCHLHRLTLTLKFKSTHPLLVPPKPCRARSFYARAKLKPKNPMYVFMGWFTCSFTFKSTPFKRTPFATFAAATPPYDNTEPPIRLSKTNINT